MPVTDDHSDDRLGATALTLGTAKTGAIDIVSDQDYFKVELVAGQRYLFEMTASGIGSLDTAYLSLYGPSGSWIDSAADDDLAQFSYIPTTTGTYYLEATELSDDAIGTYTVKASKAGLGTTSGEILSGSSGNDWLEGFAGNDTLNGNAGADTMLGGAGNDSYIVDSVGDKVYEATTVGGTMDAGGIDTVRSSVSYTLGSFVEKLVLTGSNAINGRGNSLANSLTGNAAANTLNGSAGADTMLGGAGNDTYIVENMGDQVYETMTAGGTINAGGIDTVRSSVSYVLSSFVENLVLTGSGTLNGSGNSLANRLTGNSAANSLTGGAGADTMLGGGGNDTYAVDSAGDKVYETTTVGGTANAGGTDTVRSSVSYTLGSFVEKLALTGSSTINGTGNFLSNSITGNSANNVLSGGGGHDTLRSGSGNDTLLGGIGNDTLVGGAGLDVFRFNTAPSTSSNVDMVVDFNVVDDTIQLENAAFTALARTGTLSANWLRIGATAADSNDYLVYNPTTGALFYDADGSGSAVAPIQFSTLSTGLALTGADFFVT